MVVGGKHLGEGWIQIQDCEANLVEYVGEGGSVFIILFVCSQNIEWAQNPPFARLHLKYLIFLITNSVLRTPITKTFFYPPLISSSYSFWLQLKEGFNWNQPPCGLHCSVTERNGYWMRRSNNQGTDGLDREYAAAFWKRTFFSHFSKLVARVQKGHFKSHGSHFTLYISKDFISFLKFERPLSRSE